MSKPKVYADFHNLDDSNRLRLTCTGTIDDLARQRIELSEGMALTFYMDDADDQGDADELRRRGSSTTTRVSARGSHRSIGRRFVTLRMRENRTPMPPAHRFPRRGARLDKQIAPASRFRRPRNCRVRRRPL